MVLDEASGRVRKSSPSVWETGGGGIDISNAPPRGGITMSGAPKGLLVLSAIALVIAIVATITGDVGTIPPEGYSRASTNLALLAIGIHLIEGRASTD